jgi:hypothetical protein
VLGSIRIRAALRVRRQRRGKQKSGDPTHQDRENPRTLWLSDHDDVVPEAVWIGGYDSSSFLQ